jgi:hypothetical protein
MIKQKQASLLIDNLIKLMHLAEQEKREGNLTDGAHKKQFVMQEMKNILKWEDSIIDEILLIVIDVLIEVDKDKIQFNQKVKKSLLCCWNK